MKSKKPSDASTTTSSSRTSRRRFTKAVATTIVAAPLASKFAQAQKPTGTKETTAPPNPQATAQPPPSPLTEAYAEVARARFGDQLTPEQFEQVKKDLEANVQAAERLRAVKLKNEDEPDFVFNVE
jgi:hypothetical protein